MDARDEIARLEASIERHKKERRQTVNNHERLVLERRIDREFLRLKQMKESNAAQES